MLALHCLVFSVLPPRALQAHPVSFFTTWGFLSRNSTATQTRLTLFISNTLPCNLRLSQVTVNSSEITTEETQFTPPPPPVLSYYGGSRRCATARKILRKVSNTLFCLVSKRKTLQLFLWTHHFHLNCTVSIWLGLHPWLTRKPLLTVFDFKVKSILFFIYLKENLFSE